MTLETFFQKFDTFADAPNAVAKMRELVLNLAVSGKLVRQDPNDEAADELLSRLARERSHDRRSQTESAPVSIRYDLPDGWAWARFQDVAIIASNLVSPEDYPDFIHLAPDNIEKGNGVLLPCSTVREDGVKSANRRFYSGQIVYSKIRPNLAKVVVVDFDGLCSADMYPINALIDPSFLQRYMLSGPFLVQAVKTDTRVAMPKINQTELNVFAVPVPPLAEQKRIVGKVDELMALCDRLEAEQQERQEQHASLARASLARFAEAATPANLNLLFHKSYTIPPADLRKSILTLAVQGKLVSHCRETPKLAELKTAKTELCEEEGIHKRPPVDRVSRKDWSHFLPKHWELPNFDDALVIVSGVTKGRVLTGRKTLTVPYLRVANVQRGYVDLDVLKEIEVLPEDLERYSLEVGDVLMTEGGDWDKVGRAAVWRDEIAVCIHQNHVYRIRSPRKADLIPEWIECYVNSPLGRSFFESASKQTTNLASINMTQLRGCPLPLPPSDEQRRIVAKVDELMALVDALETQLATARSSAGQLLEAVVVELTNH